MMYKILAIAMSVLAVNACGPDPPPVPGVPSLCSQMTTIPIANKCPPGIAKYFLVETYQSQDYTPTLVDKTACGPQMSICSLLNRDQCGALKLEIIEGQLGSLAKIEGFDLQTKGYSNFIFNWTVLATDKVYFEQQLIFWGTTSAALALTAPPTIPDVLIKSENIVGFGVIGRGASDYLLLQSCCKKLAYLFISETVVKTLPPCTGDQKPQYPQPITQGITADLQNVQLNYTQFKIVTEFNIWNLQCDAFISQTCAAAAVGAAALATPGPATPGPATPGPAAPGPAAPGPAAPGPAAPGPAAPGPAVPDDK